jgi:hypothetical protein
MADEYIYGMHPFLRNDSRVQRLGAKGPNGIPGGLDPRGLGSEASASMNGPGTYQLGTRPGSMSQNAQGDLEQFGQAVQRRFARVAYTEQTRFNPGTKIHHLAEEPKLRAVGPQRRVNQAMIKAKMMESSATVRSVPDVNNQVQKIVAERNAVSAQRRNIQIAADLEREATSLEQQAIKLANKGFQIPDNIPEIQVAVGSSNTMNTAMILGALALGVIAATMWARR